MAKGVTLLTTLALTPLILSYLGPEQYGYWLMLGQVLAYLGIFDFGVTAATIPAVARVQGRETSELSILATTSIMMHAVVGLGIVLPSIALIIPLREDVAGFLRIPGGVLDVLLLAIIGLGVGLPMRGFHAVFRGRQHIVTVRIIETLMTLCKAALIICMLRGNIGFIALPLSSIIINTLAIVAYWTWLRRTTPTLRVHPSNFRLSTAITLLSPSIWLFGGAIAALAIYSTDALIIGAIISPAAVSVYLVTTRVLQICREQLYELSSLLTPVYAQLHSQGETRRLGEVYLLTLKVVVGAAFAAAVGCYSFGETFVRLWVGSEYFAGEWVLAAAAASLPLMAIFHPSSVILVSMLRPRLLVSARMVEATLNVTLSIVLAQAYGILGAALGTLIGAAAVSAWFIPALALRALRITIVQAARALVPLLVGACGFYLIGFVLSPLATNWVGLVGCCVLYAATAVALFASVVLSNNDRHWLVKRLNLTWANPK